MLRLNRYILGLVLWLAFLFNVERLDLTLNSSDVFNIATPIYAVVVVVVACGLLLPNWRPTPLWHVHIIASTLFVIAAVWHGRPDWGGAYTYLSLFELAAVLVSATLAYMVGRLSADFVATVRALMFSDFDNRVYSIDAAESVIKREMQYSRRMSRPLSVMVLDADNAGAPQQLEATVQEIQRLLVKRHSLVALTRLMARTLRRTDFILDQTSSGRLVIVMPELGHAQSDAIIDRLGERAQRRLGLQLRYGVASFPEQGLTFEELLYQAEQALQPKLQHERRIDVLERDAAATDKLSVVETR